LLAQFQSHTEAIKDWDLETRALFETMIQQVLHASSLSTSQKKQFFEAINSWGDPRLRTPANQDYWVDMMVADAPLLVATHLVTIKEWLKFLETEYDNDAHWSAEGLNWRDNRRVTWQQLAASPDSQKYLFDNQPVVGVSWFEAEAYACCHNARLMDFFEREDIVRGPEKRRYPWGRDFKHGFANTEESGFDKPSAVGLFTTDQTPDGIFDLAGNVAEWQGDDVGDQRIMHPGCWAKDSISTWAKASESLSPGARLAYLGFRLVRDK
jgi:formylglycine-generating enzyme required for sulfatase activity